MSMRLTGEKEGKGYWASTFEGGKHTVFFTYLSWRDATEDDAPVMRFPGTLRGYELALKECIRRNNTLA